MENLFLTSNHLVNITEHSKLFKNLFSITKKFFNILKKEIVDLKIVRYISYRRLSYYTHSSNNILI